MNIILDTHALLWNLTEYKRLSPKVRTTLDEASGIFLPTIVLLELLYTLQKKKEVKKFSTILNRIKRSKKYFIVSLDLDVVEIMPQLSFKFEMHDAVIVATAQLLKAPLVTKDETIQKIYKDTIW